MTLTRVRAAATVARMHTHFASGMHAVSVFFAVLLVGTFWKLAWLRAGQSSNPTVKALAAAALFQYN